MDPFAWSLARRTVLALGVSGAATASAVIVTDEPTNTMAMRLARIAALAPLLSCAALLAVAGHARARGEVRALEALGASPWEACRGAAVVGVAAGLVALTVLAGPWSDASSLFPRITPAIEWLMSPDAHSARFGGLTVFADGAIDMGRAGSFHGPARPDGIAALECIAPLALGVPAFAVTPMSARLRVVSLLATALSLIVVFHLVAAGRVNGVVGVVAAAPILVALVHGRARG